MERSNRKFESRLSRVLCALITAIFISLWTPTVLAGTSSESRATRIKAGSTHHKAASRKKSKGRKKKKRKSKAAKARAKKRKAAKRAAQASRVEAFVIVSPLLPVAYNRLVYAAPVDDKPARLWDSGHRVNSSPLGLGVRWNTRLVPGLRMDVGLRYQFVTPSISSADYDERVTAAGSEPNYSLYTQTKQSATNLGAFVALYPLSLQIAPGLSYQLGGGVDLSYSKVSFSSTYNDDSGATSSKTLVSGSSSLNVLSLRVNNTAKWGRGPWKATFGVNLLKPVLEFGHSYSFSSSNSQSMLLNSVSEKDDLKKALGHEKSAFGVEVTVGVARTL